MSNKTLFHHLPTHNSILLAALLLVVSIYFSTTKFPFVWDDYQFILGWDSIQQPVKNLIPLITGDLPAHHAGTYRPTRSLLYALTYQLYQSNPNPYHIQATLLHCFNTVLVFILTKKLSGRFTASLTSLFFALHPLHSESIAWITASYDIFSITFFLLSLIFIFSPSKHFLPKILSHLLAFAAFTTSEITTTLPLFIILISIYLTPKTKTKPKYPPYFLLLFIYFFIRQGLLDIPSLVPQPFFSFKSTLLLIPVLISKYFQLLFFPINLGLVYQLLPRVTSLYQLDYNFLSPPPPPQLFHPQVIFSIIFLIFIVIASAVCFKTKFKFISFGLSWIILSLIPVLQLVPQALLLSNRYTYISVIGSSFILASTVHNLIKANSIHFKLIGYISIPTIAIIYGYFLITQLFSWSSPLNLWTTALVKDPNSSYITHNLAVAQARNDDSLSAFSNYIRSVNLNPNHLTARMSLAQELIRQNKFHQAIPHLEFITKHQHQNQEAKELLLYSITHQTNL